MNEADFHDVGEAVLPNTAHLGFSGLVKKEVSFFAQQNGALTAQLDTGRSRRHAGQNSHQEEYR